MKKFFKKFIPFICICFFLANALLAPAAFALEAENQSVTEMLAYFKEHGNLAETDILRIVHEMHTTVPDRAPVWQDIMEYVLDANREGAYGYDIPENLPNDRSLAIVILGYALNDDGSMKAELVGRLETGLDFARAYPNAYVVVTGGGTAKNAPSVTEGGAMAEWLLQNGLEPQRLIVEDSAANTILNVENTYKILKKDYPSVTSLAIVSSDYHLPRANALFYTKLRFCAAEEGSEPLALLPGCGYQSGHNGYEAISLQADNIAGVAGVSLNGVQAGELSTLLGIAAVRRQDGSLTITAQYENGFRRQITHGVYAVTNNKGTRISYTENGVSVGGTLSLDSEIGHFYSQSYLARIRATDRDNRAASLRRNVEMTLKQASASLNVEASSAFEPSYIALCNTIALVIIFLFLIVKAGAFHRTPVKQKTDKKYK